MGFTTKSFPVPLARKAEREPVPCERHAKQGENRRYNAPSTHFCPLISLPPLNESKSNHGPIIIAHFIAIQDGSGFFHRS